MSTTNWTAPASYLRRHYCAKCRHNLDAVGADGKCAALRTDLTRCGCEQHEASAFIPVARTVDKAQRR
jgi:hypothetical protein